MKHIEDFIAGISSLTMAITELDMQYLIVDRTNWKRGTKNFNLLTIGNLMNSVFVPLYVCLSEISISSRMTKFHKKNNRLIKKGVYFKVVRMLKNEDFLAVLGDLGWTEGFKNKSLNHL